MSYWRSINSGLRHERQVGGHVGVLQRPEPEMEGVDCEACGAVSLLRPSEHRNSPGLQTRTHYSVSDATTQPTTHTSHRPPPLHTQTQTGPHAGQ